MIKSTEVRIGNLAIGKVPTSYLKCTMENIPNPPRQFREFCKIELNLN